MMLSAVFWLSFSSLAFEVLLARVFAISQWNHLGFMVISLALFGFAASGTFFSMIDTPKADWPKKLSTDAALQIFIMIYGLTAVLSFGIVNRIPLDYFRLPLQHIQLAYLFAVYMLLAIPFFLSGAVLALAYARMPHKSGWVYFASMAGSACGAVVPLLFLPLLAEGELIVATALAPLGWCLMSDVLKRIFRKKEGLSLPGRIQKGGLWAGMFVIISASLFIACRHESVFKVIPSPYKGLSQTLRFPDTRITRTVHGIQGRIDDVHSPYIRFAPGLSLKYLNPLPNQWAAFTDGDNPYHFYDFKSCAGTPFAGFMLPYAGYYPGQAGKKVLLIQNGGGSALPCAVASGAKDITLVVQNRHMARRISQQYRHKVINENPRAWLQRSQESFDLIQIESWGASLPGAGVLTQEYLFTCEAMSAYIRHLSPAGILILARRLLLPPSDSLRLWATAYESLKRLSIPDPHKHLAILRNWDTFTLLVSARPLNNALLLKEFARKMNFDLVYLPDLAPFAANHYNIFPSPLHYNETQKLAKSLLAGRAEIYYKDYLLDITPQTDDRPFPGRLLKWRNLEKIYKSRGSRFYTLFMSGEIIVGVIFGVALLVSLMLLTAPFFTTAKKKKAPFSSTPYFFGVGAGFIFVELFFIKAFTLILGDPVISFALVLAGLLIFSSIGGAWTQRLGSRAIPVSLALLIALALLLLFGLMPILHQILAFPPGWRYISALGILFPAGFLMGLPFPLGMRHLLRYPVQRAYAWSANGCASVLMSIAAVQVALSFGISKIMLCAAPAYLLALLSGLRTSRAAPII